jgi:hypothetical protein
MQAQDRSYVIGAKHDFEVIRSHQIIKSGIEQLAITSEHCHIASYSSKAGMHWMYSLPGYISSKEFGALFDHAAFLSGIFLAKQNPRLTMNSFSALIVLVKQRKGLSLYSRRRAFH